MKKYAILLLSILPLITFATTQNSEILIYKSDTLLTSDCPLDILMETNLTIKKRITNYTDTICEISTCWRGYNGTWQIQNDSLFLKNLTSSCEDYIFDLKKTFSGRKIRNGKVFANWYSGEIKAYYHIGKFKDLDTTKYNTKSLIATIKKGIIVNILIEPAYDYNFETLETKTESFDELEHLDEKKEKTNQLID
ncbi:hypothetical protein [Flavobacterium sp. UBA6031]|uniref:hypothetical protein n=1 Tax=Flavobacterium sp. UBA6031 TaxID=1946551 RepID=UPI0025BF266B|nr:hypothetical protein [Flavobacterium sp. UBA6031]